MPACQALFQNNVILFSNGPKSAAMVRHAFFAPLTLPTQSGDNSIQGGAANEPDTTE
jgi:hypothetical protein